MRREGSTTRHLSIHLVLHVGGWRAAADHAVRGHAVAVGGLRWGPALVHSARAHGHILSGRLQANTRETKTPSVAARKRFIAFIKSKTNQARCNNIYIYL